MSGNFKSPSALLLLTSLLFYSSKSLCQSNHQSNWSKKPFSEKVFIENKGQFDNLLPGSTVFFEANSSSAIVLFTDKGITYRFRELITSKNKSIAETKNENEAEQEAEQKKSINTKEHIQLIQLQWLNAKKNVVPRLEEIVSDYY